MRYALLLVALLLLAAAPAVATDWFVATTGNDYTGDGSIGNPFASLQGAVFYHALPGDTVQVRAGTYTAGNNINGDGYCSIQAPDHALVGGAPGAYITIRSYDGDLTAHFTGGIRLVRCKYLRLVGLDASAPGGGHPVSVISGCDDYADPAKRSNHIEINNCRIHDSNTSSGQLKLQQSDYITVQDCELYNIGAGGAVIDCVWVEHVMSRRNYIHDAYGAGGFYKGGSMYSTFDGNVNTPAQPGLLTYGFMPGGGTGPSFANPDPAVRYESMYTVIRNNIVVGQTRGATPTEESAYCYVYNNLMKDCATAYPDYYSYITQISTGMPRFDDYTRHFYVFNNIFYDSDGNMRPYGWVLSGGGSGNLEDWQTGNNCFYNNGQPLIHESDTPDPTAEAGATYGDPHLSMTGATPTTWQGWVNYFRPLWDTQSNAMLKDKGSDTAGLAPQPGVIADIEGNVRPRDTGWDIGPYEYQGAAHVPIADFSSDKSWGAPPCAVAFTDGSAGGPTAWSWSFGDGGTSTARNPSHTYLAKGKYTVALTATNAGGSDTETKTDYISVKALDADFSFSPVGGGAPLAVAFTDTSTNSPTAWAWAFGDGGTSTAQSPSHAYNDAGYYSVALTASNATGSDTEIKSNCITACDQVFVYPTSYSAGGGQTVSGSLTDLQAEDGVAFDVASGAQTQCTTGQTIFPFSIYFSSDTAYTADQVYGMSFEYLARSNVAGDPQCQHLFLNDWEDTGCPLQPFPNTNTWITVARLGGMSKYVDADGVLTSHICGNRSSVQFHILYDVMRWRLYLKPGQSPQPPIADFVGAPASGYFPLEVSFTDLSSNTPTSWSWTFGDGGTSTVRNPSHTYAAAGSYDVALTATNSVGSDTVTKTGYVQSLWPLPAADFSALPTTGTNPLTVAFTDSSTGGPTSWSWAFGDSGTSTLQSPSHDYTSPGTYTVALTATNTTGSDTETKTDYITVARNGLEPVTDFTATPTTGNIPLPVSFTDTSAGSPTTWSWTFGDGGASTEQNPSHTYTIAGTYTVKLVATNAGGNDTKIRTDYIVALPPPPVADFTGTPTSGDYPLTVVFTDASLDDPTAWSWTFGDGGRTTTQNPSHTYTMSGSYDVALTATNAGGSDTQTKVGYVSVGTGPVELVPTSYSKSGNCPLIGGTLQDVFTENAQYLVIGCDPVSRASADYFTFDTPYVPSQVSAMRIEMLAHNSRDDTPRFTFMCLNPITTSWNSMYSGLWTTTDQWMNYDTTNITGHMDSSGVVLVMVCGCPTEGNTNSYEMSWDVVRMKLTLTDGPTPPGADFYASRTSGLKPLAVDFTDASTNGVTAWSWSFGDGGASTVQNPGHTYANAGLYTVALTATNSVGADTETKSNYINAIPPVPIPVADFSGTPTLGGKPLPVTFTDASTNTPTSWSWDFGDGTAGTEQNPSHTYTRGGGFDVALTATNDGGSDTETKVGYVKVASFPDVLTDSWAWSYVEACVTAGIVGGYPSGNYEPGWIVTRGQMAGFISRALAGGDSHVPTPPATAHFPDVPTDHWAYKYIEYAYANNIVGGYPGGNYEPDWDVDRGQMAGFIARAIVTPTGEAGLAGYTPPATPSFPDVATDFWTYKHIEYLRAQGVVGGYPDGWYHPEIACTREQMAVFIARAFALPR